MYRRSLATALILAALAAAPVTATRGVAVDLGKIEISSALAPGGTYKLPTLGVRNPGTEAAWFTLGAGGTGADGTLPLSQEWFSFSPARFQLQPGESVPVAIDLHLPAGVEPGHYEGLLRAELVPETTGAVVGAAAGARLSFEVKASGSVESHLRELLGLLAGVPGWFYGALVLSIAAVGLRVLSRRFSIRLERRA